MVHPRPYSRRTLDRGQVYERRLWTLETEMLEYTKRASAAIRRDESAVRDQSRAGVARRAHVAVAAAAAAARASGRRRLRRRGGGRGRPAARRLHLDAAPRTLARLKGKTLPCEERERARTTANVRFLKLGILVSRERFRGLVRPWSVDGGVL